MWLMRINNVPDAVFDASRVPTNKEGRRELRLRSSHLYAIGDGRRLMLVLGVLPPSKLSQTAYLWLVYLRHARFNRGQLRQMVRVFRKFLIALGYTRYLADVRGKVNERFAWFFGAELVKPGLVEWRIS